MSGFGETGLHSGRRRSGLTLIELLLVLALLVAFTAMALPSLQKSFENRRLQVSAEALRTAWAKARVEAMKTGHIQGFRYELNGSGYRVEPYYAADGIVELPDALGQNEITSSQFVVQEQSTEEALPEGIVFRMSHQRTETRGIEASDALMEQDALSGIDANPWSPPILFYPDGTCSDAHVLLANDNDRLVEVSLRSLTGMTKIGEIFVQDEFSAVPAGGD